MTWRNVFVCGLVASAAIAGCTVTAGTGNGPDGSIATGGETATGGAAATGGKDGGKGGTAAGGAATGGASSGGSTADAAVTSCAAPYANACDSCIETKCCTEWLDCANDKDCGKNLDTGELYCIQRCLLGDVADASSGGPDPEACANSCAHADSTVVPATSALIACMRGQKGDAGPQNCSTACFNAELP